MDEAHIARLKYELVAAGVSPYGLKKFSVRYLPTVINQDEHLKAIIYGRYGDESGTLNLNAGLLAATDKRVIFLDHKPGYTHMEELRYDEIRSVNQTTAVFSAVTLNTIVKIYTLRFVNKACAAQFAQYIHSRLKAPRENNL